MRAVGVLAIAVGLAIAASGAQWATAQETAPHRTVVVGSLALDQGDVLTLALHPSAAPIQLLAAARSDLEVCPGQLDGGVPDPGGFSSWPSWAGFTDCLPFADDGTVTLPSTGIDSFHLAFLVRGRNPGRTKVARLEITYAPGDGYFEIFPPPIAPGGRGPRVAVRPMSATTIGAQGYGIAYEDAPRVEVEVRQHGRSVRRTSDRPPGGDAQAYGPVRLGSTVRVTSTNRGTRAALVRIAIAWN